MTTALHGRRALVLYGSETGNAQDVAEELGRIAERLRFDTEVAELNAINLVRQEHFRCCISHIPARSNCYNTQ
jgi:flavodoxin